MPLGLLYIASGLRDAACDVSILDCYASRLYGDELTEKISAYGPDLIGISSTTPSFGVAATIARQVKDSIGDIPVVAGGFHPTVLPEDVLKLYCFDFVIRGEGEEVMIDLARHLRGEVPLDGIAGLSFRKNGIITHMPGRKPVHDLDRLAFPAYDLIDKDLYYDPPHWEMACPSFDILGSRGCVFDCSFCSHKFMSNGRRRRSAGNIVAEIRFLTDNYHARQINFVDPIFPLNEREGIELCDELIKNGLHKKITWLCETNVMSVTGRLLKKMREAGCRKIIFGIESGDQGILYSIGKRYSRKDITRAVRMAKEAGIETIGLFIIGFPGETKESIKETICFSRSIGLDYAKFNRLVPFPGTRIYKELQAGQGHLLAGEWADYIPYPFIKNKNGPYTSDRVSESEMNSMQKEAYLGFYFRPYFLLRLFCKKGWLKSLKRLFRSLVLIRSPRN
jgi:radical SAM superfamily enzyme YgiQ (UPF0313 family)